MNELQILNIEGIDCYEKDGTVYLRLETVARGLGFTKTDVKISETGFRKEYVRIDWPRVGKYLEEIGFPSKLGKDDFIPENVFYRLAMKAKNEVAEAFQAKIADVVIPSIRKNGGYIVGQAEMAPEELMAKALLVAQKTLADREEKILTLTRENQDMQPKALFADAVSTAKTTILIGELAKLLKQNGVEMGQNRLFGWMRDNGYLIKRKGIDYNMPTQYAMELGLFEIKETAITHSDGHVTINKTPKVTGKGQQYFVNQFLKGRISA